MDADASDENGALSVVLALGGWLGDRLKASGIAVRDPGVTETSVLECQGVFKMDTPASDRNGVVLVVSGSGAHLAVLGGHTALRHELPPPSKRASCIARDSSGWLPLLYACY